MGAMTVDEIFKDRKKFSQQVFDVASTDLFNMGIQVIVQPTALHCMQCNCALIILETVSPCQG